VTVSGNNYSSPCQVKWSVGTSYTIAAISPHTENGLISTFSSWSDGGAQSHSVTASLDSFSLVYTANFIVSKPVQISGVDVGGDLGSPVHVTWEEHPNDSVNYAIYRKVKHNGTMGQPVLLTTLSHTTTSFDDPDYVVMSHSSDLLYYDVRAHHVPSDTYADQQWQGGVYGGIEAKRAVDKGETMEPKPTAKGYALQVNPNPFNPSTRIGYDLPSAGYVTIELFNVAGRRVGSLVNGFQEKGSYALIWEAKALASGVYYAHFKVANGYGQLVYAKVTRLLLIK